MKSFKDFINEDIPVFCNAGGSENQHYKFDLVNKNYLPVFAVGGGREIQHESLDENLNPRIVPVEHIQQGVLSDPDKSNLGISDERNSLENIGGSDIHGSGFVHPHFTNEQAQIFRTLSGNTNHRHKNYEKIITPYSTDSYNLNNTLFKNHSERTTPPDEILSNSYEDSHINIHELDELIRNHRLPHEVSVYTGLHFHPLAHKGRIYVHPAYMSTSLSPHVAKDFGETYDSDYSENSPKIKNIMRLDLSMGQKHLFTDPASIFPGQGELILPRGTRFQLGQKPVHVIKGKFRSHFSDNLSDKNVIYHLWHGRILR